MDTDKQLNTVLDSKLKRHIFEDVLFYIVPGLMFVVLAIFQHDSQLLIGGLVFWTVSLAWMIRIRIIGILALLIIISLISVALFTKGSNQQVSSTSFVNALFVALGAVAVTLGSQLQKFFHDRGFRGREVYVDGVSTRGDWGGGDYGGDGGSGDCG